jgi:hypothetical protein
MFSFKNIFITAIAFAGMMLATKAGMAQTSVPDAVYYVCAEQGFKLAGPAGFDHYQWSEDNMGMPGADSNNILVASAGAANVGNSYETKTYHLQVMNNGSCWSDQASYVVYVLPKMELSLTGYSPPYCEHLSHDITLTAHINGGVADSALSLPPGITVSYNWLVEPYNNSNAGISGWNAGIVGPTNAYNAQVVTPQTTNIDNNYTLKIQYAYPASTNVNTDVVGNCNDAYTQNVHADPAPATPSINFQAL